MPLAETVRYTPYCLVKYFISQFYKNYCIISLFGYHCSLKIQCNVLLSFMAHITPGSMPVTTPYQYATHIVETWHPRWAYRHPPMVVGVSAPLPSLLLGLTGVPGLSLLDLHLVVGE